MKNFGFSIYSASELSTIIKLLLSEDPKVQMNAIRKPDGSLTITHENTSKVLEHFPDYVIIEL